MLISLFNTNNLLEHNIVDTNNNVFTLLNYFKYWNLTLFSLNIYHLFVHVLKGFNYCYLSAADPQLLPSGTF